MNHFHSLKQEFNRILIDTEKEMKKKRIYGTLSLMLTAFSFG